MRLTLGNDHLNIALDTLGGELLSIRSRDDEAREYLWQGDPAWWERRSPLLFPIVGRLTGGEGFVDGRPVRIPLHGFAQDREFRVVSHTAADIRLQLDSDDRSRACYPFDFRLTLGYTLHDDTLSVDWRVENTGPALMPFAMGGHAGFSTQLWPDDVFEDYDVIFDSARQRHVWPVTADGRLVPEPVPFLGPVQRFGLEPGFFAVDALVFPDAQVDSVTLRHARHGHGVTLECPGFPLLALWTACRDGMTAPFLCLEPWHGYGDTLAGPFELREKPGMVCLPPGGVFTTGYRLRFF